MVSSTPNHALIKLTVPFAKEHYWQSVWSVISTFSLLLFAISASILNINLVVKSLLIIPIGLLVVRCFVLFHDFNHKAILRRSTWAKWLFGFFSFLIFTPSKVWRDCHNFHHAHNSILETSYIGSIWTLSVENWRQLRPTMRYLYRLIRNPIIIFLGLYTVFIYHHCVHSFISSPRKYFTALLIVAFHLIIICASLYSNNFSSLFLAWYAPLTLAACLGVYLFYAQHNFPDSEISTRNEWTYTNAAMDSSSFIEMPAIMHWFTGNIAYHHIHHLNHRIPFYRLPEAMKSVEEFANPKRTSLRLSDIKACLKLKLWDKKQNRLVSFDHVDDIIRQQHQTSGLR